MKTLKELTKELVELSGTIGEPPQTRENLYVQVVKAEQKLEEIRKKLGLERPM